MACRGPSTVAAWPPTNDFACHIRGASRRYLGMDPNELQPLYFILTVFLSIGVLFVIFAPQLSRTPSTALAGNPGASEVDRRRRIRRMRGSGIALVVLSLVVAVGAGMISSHIASLEAQQAHPHQKLRPSR